MKRTTIFEFEALAPEGSTLSGAHSRVHLVPPEVFSWLQTQCQRVSDAGEGTWLRMGQRHGLLVVQVTSYVGVIRAPGGYQIEVLPKIGNAIAGGAIEARCKLIDMLCCLPDFRHVKTASAKLAATRLPLAEVFISEFLRTVSLVVKSGLRGDYHQQHGNLFALRGKLLIAEHLRQNMFRADRFFTEHEEFSTNRAENRLLRAALRKALALSGLQAHQQLAIELDFVFSDIPISTDHSQDWQRVRLDRGMVYYGDALAWARLILDGESPLTGTGSHHAPSLLFPMEALFEAFVAHHLARQLTQPLVMKTQARSQHLVSHQEQNWFRLKPDLLISDGQNNMLVLDTKWKLLDRAKGNGTDKYGLAPSDFYQLYAYGQMYLGGMGDVVLIYPKTATFDAPLTVFDFAQSKGLRLWVVPFCLEDRVLTIPDQSPMAKSFSFARAASIPVDHGEIAPS